MAKKLIFTCDVCGTQRTPTNGWSQGFQTRDGRVTFQPFNEKSGSKIIKHFCSNGCENKFLASITDEWRKIREVSEPPRRIRISEVADLEYEEVRI